MGGARSIWGRPTSRSRSGPTRSSQHWSGSRSSAAWDLATFLQFDRPAVGAWMAAPVPSPEPTTPIVWIGSTDSGAVVEESRAHLQEQLPGTTAYTIADVGHYFPLLKPPETAIAAHEWLSRQHTAREKTLQ